MKKILKIIFVVILCIFILSLLKDQIIKYAVSAVTTGVTGTKTQIGSFSLGILRHSIRIRDFKIHNPKGFSNAVLVDLGIINVDYDLSSIIKGKLHLRRLDIDLKELCLEKDKEGKLNVDSLKIIEQKKETQDKKSKPVKQVPMQIDLLNLQLGRIISKDYSVGKEPSVKVYDIYASKSYKNITSANQLAALIISEPMRQAGIKGAKIYGISTLAGVGMLPITIAATFAGKDSAQRDFNLSVANLYEVSLAVLKRTGKVNKENKATGVIEANVNGASITVKLKEKTANVTQATVSARKLMLPKPEIASGILYRISEELK